ncbi:MAG: NrtA/SsuA/CpmA family ABC transporter substrate-binding protein [Deltaproteobacteria bacterium]|nr:NrtA/SsuA/CpmA family ABC transporter substrate-binding protein [Deltaproteobacteria bacterium]
MKKPAMVITVITAIILLGFGTRYFLKSRSPGSRGTESIAVAAVSDESSAPILLAENQGYFLRNGLRVSLRNYGNGVAAIRAMKSAEADISLSAEFPIVTEAFKKGAISIIACIDKYQPTYIVARKDRGIKKISDLKGKKIGAPHGSISKFYLGRFLDLHHMSIEDVTLVDIDPARPPLDEIANGSIDAVVSRQNVINPIIKQLGVNYISWPVQSGQLTYLVMSCRKEWMAGHPETIRKFLKSLKEAEDYLIGHPDEAKAIVQKRLKYDDSYIASVWPQHQFALSLDQSLIVAMKDEAQWMIDHNLTSEKQIPDFVNYVYIEGLKTVKPEAVNIIR